MAKRPEYCDDPLCSDYGKRMGYHKGCTWPTCRGKLIADNNKEGITVLLKEIEEKTLQVKALIELTIKEKN